MQSRLLQHLLSHQSNQLKIGFSHNYQQNFRRLKAQCTTLLVYLHRIPTSRRSVLGGVLTNQARHARSNPRLQIRLAIIVLLKSDPLVNRLKTK